MNSLVEDGLPLQSQIDLALSSKLYAALNFLGMILINKAIGNIIPYDILGNDVLHHFNERMPSRQHYFLELLIMPSVAFPFQGKEGMPRQ